MIDIGITKMAMIGVVALIVIGPEKLPRVARTVGALLGKAQRYVNDVKAEVNRSMELDELRKVKESMEDAARNVQNSVSTQASEFQKSWSETQNSIMGSGDTPALPTEMPPSYPSYRHPKKNWRVKRGSTPQWYKSRAGVRTKALSGAARVARYRPRKAT